MRVVFDLMALLGISLLFASVVYVIIRPPSWLAPRLPHWFLRLIADGPSTTSQRTSDNTAITNSGEENKLPKKDDGSNRNDDSKNSNPSIDKQKSDTMSMPPPPIPIIRTSTPPPPTIEEPDSPSTPKARPTISSMGPPPSFTLSAEPSGPTTSSSMMPPPPRPTGPRPPTLAQFPAANSAQRARGPAPSRGPPSSLSGGLAPPPTHSSKPSKPSRQVTLEPGHSPLDWARISGPNADLRGVDPSTPYQRVTPSMLKYHTGRKGKDAWMAINGKVYNVTPYAAFHPGGVPELMRGAGRDGSQLFGEVHPWVNYETMLAACLIGLLVDEPTSDNMVSEMDQMD